MNNLPDIANEVHAFLTQSAPILGLHLCYHDTLLRLPLPLASRSHVASACAARKAAHFLECYAFEWDIIPATFSFSPEAKIHTCPAGYTDIAVPVFNDGLMSGMLFAGTCWLHPGPPPFPDLVVPPDDAWLANRIGLVEALALRLAHILSSKDQSVLHDRRSAIIDYIHRHLCETITLANMANHLGLSPSRTTHVIKEIFGKSLVTVISTVRLQKAAQLLKNTDRSISEIAYELGYTSQSYFTERFSTQYGTSPHQYRQQYQKRPV